MAESSDYTPGVWAGHDFKDAKKAYANVVSRSYSDARSSGVDVSDLLPDAIVCNATSSLTILTDVTGSMGEWPKVMFSKLPYLEYEAKEYLGEDTEIGFGAIGDAYNDSYPVQARPYKKGIDLKDEMNALVIEGGGGGSGEESYELAALYYARNVTMPNATHPILIMIGDEDYYDQVAPDVAKRYAKVMSPSRLTAKEIFEELTRKYSVYLIRKVYGESGTSDKRGAKDQAVHDSWVKMLGEDRIVNLHDPERVVDVIFGILAKETDKVAYFQMELEGRQEPDKVDIVYKSLQTVHVSTAAKALPGKASASTMHLGNTGTATKSLMD